MPRDDEECGNVIMHSDEHDWKERVSDYLVVDVVKERSSST